MSTYVCPEFAATGIELQIIELQVQRETAQEQGSAEALAAYDAEISLLWSELAELADRYPDTVGA